MPLRQRLLHALLVALPVVLVAALARHPLLVGGDNAIAASWERTAFSAEMLPAEYVRIDVAADIPALEALPRIAAARPRAILVVDGDLSGRPTPQSRRPDARRAAERRSLVPLGVPLIAWPMLRPGEPAAAAAARAGRLWLGEARRPVRPWHRCVMPDAPVRLAGTRPAGVLPEGHAAAAAFPAPLHADAASGDWVEDPHGLRLDAPVPELPGVGAVAARLLDGRVVADRGGPIAWKHTTSAFTAVTPVASRADLCRLRAAELRGRVVLLSNADGATLVP